MKRVLERLLLAAMTLFLGTAFAAAAPLRLATFSCDVTPPPGGHPLIWTTPVATVETPLLAKGVVLDDGTNRYVLCAVDWCGLCNSTHRLFRRKIAEAAGTDVSHVAVQCVHQHTAPYTNGDAQRLLDREKAPPRYVDFAFLDAVTDRLADAVRKSLDRFQPFDRIGTGQAKVERVASSRRLPIGNGKVRSRMSSCKDPELRALPEGEIDPMLRTITLACGDRPLVRLHYYATHPQTFYGDPRASADMPGFARQRLEEKEHVFQIYFTGCAGDVAMGKYNDGTPRARDELTERLYRAMESSVASTRFEPAERLVWRTVPLALSPRTDPGNTTDDCRAKVADPALDPIVRIRAANRVSFAERSHQPFDLCSLQIGRVYLLNLPGECMVEFQRYAQQVRPDDFVAVAAYGDLGPGYICTARAFSEGGYEPSASHTGPETEARLKAAIRQLLDLPAAALRVATFSCDVTPPLGQRLYSETLTTIEHPLLAKGGVLDDGRRRYVLCAIDWCTLRNTAHAMFQRKVAEAVGTDASCVAIQCVHQHTAPSFDGGAQELLAQVPDPPKYRDLSFLDEVTDRLAAAVKESLGRLEPFDHVGLGEAEVERVASCRRVFTPEGKLLTRWSACKDPALRAMPEGPIDPLLKTITLARGDKPLVRLHYYATHPQTYYRDGRASYDFPGMARQRLEAQEGVFQIYFTGCAGDVTAGKYNDGTPEARQELAERLFAGMQASIAATRYVPVEALRWQTVAVTLPPRTDAGYDEAELRATLADPKADSEARLHAASRLACIARLRRPIELSALRLGPAWIVHLPGEPMLEFQRFAQQLKPEAFVAVAGYGLGTPGYLCTERAFEEGGYEPSASAVVPRSESLLKAAMRRLLEADPVSASSTDQE